MYTNFVVLAVVDGDEEDDATAAVEDTDANAVRLDVNQEKPSVFVWEFIYTSLISTTVAVATAGRPPVGHQRNGWHATGATTMVKTEKLGPPLLSQQLTK
ncbi:hypothetical protein RP20_CCG025452 [Aedes albopictus]|nr:hypothetical protein RP20_CCG025452 [Aedes albopictus]